MDPFDLSDLPRAEGAYLVGGTVRDLLLNRRPSDYDLAVSGNPESFGNRLLQSTPGRLVVIGKPGRSLVRVVTAERVFDICPLYGGHIENDLAQRDFTVNAMACSLASGRLIDPFGGRDDIAARTIRMVSPAAFKEDPVRLLRAFRVSAQLAFPIEKETIRAITNDAYRIRAPAGERLREELFKLLASRGAAGCLIGMARSGVLLHLFPELAKLKGCLQPPPHRHDVLDHTLETVAQVETLLEQPPPALRKFQSRIRPLAAEAERARLKCAALLHDIGKPDCQSVDPKGRIHFYGHAARGAGLVAGISRRLRFSSHETAYITTIVRHHTRLLSLFGPWQRGRLSDRAVARLFKSCLDLSPDLVIHSLADMKAKGGDRRTGSDFERFCVELVGQFYSRFEPARLQPPLVTGHDLMQRFGLPPSPLLGRLLDRVETARLAGTIATAKAAEAYVQGLLDKWDRE